MTRVLHKQASSITNKGKIGIKEEKLSDLLIIHFIYFFSTDFLIEKNQIHS